ncbi:hypothetical protein IWQ61_004206 [Dispira simplex]|nr:hypothetical protein IWQ61_004206 [Dispira simplex]
MTPPQLNVLIGATGSVASIKVPELVQGFRALGQHVNVCVVATRPALHFFALDQLILSADQTSPETLSSPPTPLITTTVPKTTNTTIMTTEWSPQSILYTDKEEWDLWIQKGDPVLHIELRKWADVFVIAPLDANTLGKFANGLCDNLLTSIVRAWDFTRKPCIICPAMNTYMWDHPFTDKHLGILKQELGCQVIPPISKTLACGDTGMGAMESPGVIIAQTLMIVEEYRRTL